MMQSIRLKRLEKNKHTVSTLTLHLENEVNDLPSSPSRSDFDEWMTLKHLRYRQRQFSPWRSPTRHLQYDKTFLNMALSGKNYLPNSRGSDVNFETSLKTRNNDETEPAVHLPKIKEIYQPRKRNKVEATSYFQNDFGFNMSRTDSFLGTKTPSRIRKKQELDALIADQARRHIFACSNVGSVRKSCRSNESVSRLKETIGFHNERGQTTPSVESESSPVCQYAKSPVKLPSSHKTVGVFTRGELTRHGVAKKNGLDYPEVTGISLL